MNLIEQFPRKLISPLLDVFPSGVVSLDLETTGLSPLSDKIVEIAAVKVTVDEELEIFHSVVNPQIEIPAKTTAIHQITDEMVKNGPKMEELIDDFLSFTENLPILAHNALFDIGFLLKAFKSPKNYPSSPIYDTIKLARKYLPGAENHKLSTLVKYFNSPYKDSHRATPDAFACLHVMGEICHKMRDSRVSEILAQGLLFNFSDLASNKIFKLPDRLEGLLETFPSQECIEIQYQNKNMTKYPDGYRKIKPIGMVPMKKGSFLYAQCLHTDQFKSFALNKIISFRKVKDESKN